MVTLTLAFRDKVKTSWKTAFISAVVIGLLVHLYKFTNNFPNHDALYNYYSNQNMVGSGRWFLMIACGFSSYFDLPWITGLFAVLYAALTAVIIVIVFEIENPCTIIISSGLLVSFPAVTETMFFEYTADGYMMAMLFSCLAVLLSRIEIMDNRWCVMLSAVLICLSCAIYQAYVSFALVMAICYFVMELLQNRYERKAYVKWIGIQACVYAVGLVLYYICWIIAMRLQECKPTSYLGIAEIGQINLDTMFSAAKKAIVSLYFFLFEHDFVEHGFTLYGFLSFLSVLLLVIGLIIAVRKSRIYKRSFELILLVCAITVIPFVLYLWMFTSPGVVYGTRMLQAVVLLFIAASVLIEKWSGAKMTDLASLIFVAVIINNAIMANICYGQMERCYERSYANAIELSTRIHLEDNGKAESVVFIGRLKGWYTEEEQNDPSILGLVGPLKKQIRYSYVYGNELTALFLSQYTDFNLSFYLDEGVVCPAFEFLNLDTLSSGNDVLYTPIKGENEGNKWYGYDEIQELGVWPANDSVQLIGDTIFVKLSDVE